MLPALPSILPPASVYSWENVTVAAITGMAGTGANRAGGTTATSIMNIAGGAMKSGSVIKRGSATANMNDAGMSGSAGVNRIVIMNGNVARTGDTVARRILMTTITKPSPGAFAPVFTLPAERFSHQ
jgi:hypothetical protein